MKMQNVALDQIVWNPWRDEKLFPIDPDHIKGLCASINEHGFFASLKGRRRSGKIELGCGHARFEAAKKVRLETIPIFIDEIDDDGMLQLMTDENALQSGSNPGAVMNEVAAVTRRLIDRILSSDNCPEKLAKLFNGTKGIKQTRTKLRTGSDVHRTLGVDVIRAYLGHNNPERAPRGERQIREAISALKQSGYYDEMVGQAILKHPEPASGKQSKSRDVVTTPKKAARSPRILDERTANLFPNDHQFHAFREAVTTRAAQQVIPVSGQYALAKSIMKPPEREEGEKLSGAATKKQIGAPYIKMRVQTAVQEGMKQQREINKEEKALFLAEQREARIDSELHSANASLRSLLSALTRLQSLAKEFPAHPKIGGFAARLDTLAAAIEQFSKRIK